MAARTAYSEPTPILTLPPFKHVSREVRNQIWTKLEQLNDTMEPHGFAAEVPCRDGPLVEIAEKKWRDVIAEDAETLRHRPAVVAITGLPTRGIHALLDRAADLGVPQLHLHWPGTLPIATRGRVLLSSLIDSAGYWREEVGRVLHEYGASLHKAFASQGGHSHRVPPAPAHDPRPVRLEYLRNAHDPLPLSPELLAERAGLPRGRVEAMCLLAWDDIDLHMKSARALAKALDVPLRALLVDSDRDAGIIIRCGQIELEAKVRRSSGRVRAQALRQVFFRTDPSNELARLSIAQIRAIFSHAERSQGESK
ncbi:MAG: hypothetical protein HY275_12955 [Gemmatimonadetes bacterium]|nr:hypothetical protein [Gemmatimonadota bacterium]